MTAEFVDYLTPDDLLDIAAEIVDYLRVRDLGLLASAAARPRMTAFGADAYPTFEDKAAALMHSIARNHALIDGNKPLAWSATRVFCLLNGRDLAMPIDDAETMVIDVEAGRLDVPELAMLLDATLAEPSHNPVPGAVKAELR